MPRIVCFGEVLWDVFPKHKKIGGAPLNVALRMKSLGIDAQIISKVGNDSLGDEIISFIEQHGIEPYLIQTGAIYPTGQVNVMLNDKGSASYDIKYPVTWDKIVATAQNKKAVASADVFVFGSLVCRDEVSRTALFELLEQSSFSVFDVNLRPPHYSPELLEALMKKADFIKFNDDELFEIAAYLGSPHNYLEQNIRYVAEKTKTKQICVTKGRHGAVYFDNGKMYYNSGFKIDVLDTVGAGDSFLASLIAKLLLDESPQYAIDFACSMGALVAQSEGPNPTIQVQDVLDFMA